MSDMQTSSLADFMAEHRITGVIAYQGLERDDSGWERHAFRFQLDIDGELYLGNAPYRAGTGHEPAAVTIADCFGAVLSDISSIMGYDDWADWAEGLGLLDSAASVRKARSDFREIQARYELLRDAIGEGAIEDAFAIASEL
jgi:hypothetical protein